MVFYFVDEYISTVYINHETVVVFYSKDFRLLHNETDDHADKALKCGEFHDIFRI